MAVNRQANLLGQQRVDIPHLRAIESSICYDFDAVGLMMSGGIPCVVKGFNVVNYTTCVGASATSLVLRTSNGLLCHPAASDSGTFFQVPSDRSDEILNSSNTRIVGSWTAGTDNYVGIDILRGADSTTVDTVSFLDTESDSESNRRVPLARTLDYVITISSSPFNLSPTVCPNCIVTLSTTGTITAIRDARNLLFRLADGGDAPTSTTPYSWPGGRNEGLASTAYVAGDRSIQSMKEWMAATMTRLQEIGGGEYWYSLTVDRNVRFAQGGSFDSNGEAFEWVSNNLHWKGLKFIFDNSTGHVNEVADQETDLAGLTNLADGDCIYVDLNRSSNKTGASALVAQKTALTTLGGSTVPGQRWVLAYRVGDYIYIRDQSYPVGSSFKLATTSAAGNIKTTINANGDDEVNPIAVGLADSSDGYYTATCGGISRNVDLGITTLTTQGNLVIGRGGDAGDDSIFIQTDQATRNTVIYGKNDGQIIPALKVVQGSTDSQTIITTFASRDTGGTIALPSTGVDESTDKVNIFRDGSISVSNVFQLPQQAVLSNQDVRCKFVFKPDRIWIAPCRCILHTATTFGFGTTWVSIGSHTWERATTGIVYGKDADGLPGLGLLQNDRILIWDEFRDYLNEEESKYYGIYKVVTAGIPSVKAVIQRTDDAVDRAMLQGITTSITEGWLAGKFITLNTPNPITTDSTPLNWQFTVPEITRDQFCIMWHDNSLTVLCESPPYLRGYTP